MKKSIIFLILIFIFITALYGEDFQAQKDSFFGETRTKIIWSVGSGLSSGSANGFLGMYNGISGNAELLRLIGRIKPASRIIEYIWMKMGIDYNLYEDSNNIYETAFNQIIMGIGLQISDEGIWQYITPYIGGGAGFGVVLHHADINSQSPQMFANEGAGYFQTGGLEFKLANAFTFFIEENYMWGAILEKENYIPNKYNSDTRKSNIPSNETFVRKEIYLNQLTIKAGVRFYWGQNMFWFYPFFWEK